MVGHSVNFFSVTDASRFRSVNQVKIVSYNDCFEQLNLA